MTEKEKKLVELNGKIQSLRKYIHNLIEKKNDLRDPEVLAASKMLDAVLNEYNNLIKDKFDIED
ncbi:MAG TPA: aspartyl-phosphate phosphatase Spo0E family protein [Clostridiaceae bacterium]|nr:aspartyl-phosphate phosphatase Spo0E family protein [Clostridiaceae bacterium]